MKYLLRDGKVEYSGSKQALIKYIQEAYPDDYWVKEYGSKFNDDFGSFKFTIECLGLELNDKMSNQEYKKRKRK